MTELEINKEYTYSQICAVLGWDKKAGNSKKAQINEIESAYEFYHPQNNKTHKEKKSYIFTRKLRELSVPSKSNSAGNNNKNIRLMSDYLLGILDPDDNEYYSFTDWYCKKLGLLKKEYCNVPYMGSDIIDSVCEKEGISNDRLFCKYISSAKSELKNMFLKALEYMQKKNICIYEDGYMFTYRLGRRSLGHVNTNMINDIITNNETAVCNDLNEEYNFSDKLSGRQNLLVIYGNETYTKYYNELKISALMDNERAIELLNEELETQHETYHKEYGSICAERPITAYYRGIAVTDVNELTDPGTGQLALKVTNIIRKKTRKTISKLHYANKWTGEIIYPYDSISYSKDIIKIEKLLFQNFDENLVTDKEKVCPLNLTIEEIIDLPVMSDVQSVLTNAVCVE